MSYGKPTIEEKEEAQEQHPWNLSDYGIKFSDLNEKSKNDCISYLLEAIKDLKLKMMYKQETPDVKEAYFRGDIY